jgi:signal transduction histidine kinase
LDLIYRAEGRIPRLSFDPNRVTQLMRNLLSNVIKYTKVGQVTVTVRQQIADRRVRVEVTNTGIGISAKNQRALFQPFVRLTEEKLGTGLGLAIAKGIIEAHGGTIGVRSAPGKGSTFWFELPRR